MNKKLFIILVVLFIAGMFATTYNISLVGADSGFDSSYDSGGSDFDTNFVFLGLYYADCEKKR